MTMKDIAREFGISVATVSRALKNSPRISEERRKAIQQYARCHRRGAATQQSDASATDWRHRARVYTLLFLIYPYWYRGDCQSPRLPDYGGAERRAV